MTTEMLNRLKQLNDDAHDLLCEPELVRDDFVEHTLYFCVRALNKLINQLEAKHGKIN